MIILDYSQVAIATVFQFPKELSKTADNKDEAINILRHAILSSIKYYKKQYGSEYGDIVIACDGENYWRKEFFPNYKYGRSESRKKSDLDWKLIFDIISQVREELIENFPYKVIRIDGAEADDIIGTLCKWTQTNGNVSEGLFEEPQQVMIISSDGDFKQLHKYPNVKQWSPMQNKFVKVDDPKLYLIQHIVKAGDDGIPNILSDDDVFVKGIRQKSVYKNILQRFLDNGVDGCEDELQRKNWKRNQTLIDLDFIPESISKSIIDSYENQEIKGNKTSIMNYLIKHQCRLLLEEIEQF
jgi:5'-3' exonuclease